MSTSSILGKVQSYMNSSAGKQKLKHAVMSGPIGVKLSSASEELQSAIADSVPTTLKKSISVSTQVNYGNNNDAYILADIGGNLFRPSLEPHKYSGAYNIVGLFSKGWSYASWKAPSGYWHGQFTYARAKKEADPFIAKAVSDWSSKWSDEIGTREIKINSMYT